MKPSTIPELQSLICEYPRLLPVGARTKTALSRPESGVTRVDLSGLRGLLEYRPEEYTFTALAGTPVVEVEAALADNAQYLPFDPVLVEAGATLGGTVASGLSGPGRYRFGGVRDFLLGVQFIDGRGRALRGGGKVVKNAAGFDLPKLMVGSLGAYGALTELSFKVFPRPAAFVTVQAAFDSLPEALEALVRLSGEPLDLYALDLAPVGVGAVLQARLGGDPRLFPKRVERLRAILGGGEELDGEAETALWRSAREFGWAPVGNSLVKVPLTPRSLLNLEAGLVEHAAARRYSVGANLAWVSWPGALDRLDALLVRLGLAGLTVRSEHGPARLGVRTGESFAARVKTALDPEERWVEV
jgi:glycolate oxidase FAD binding subunit